MRINEKAPHQAVICITYELMEVLNTGQVSGRPIQKDSKLYTVKGKDFEECQAKLKEFFNKIESKPNE